MKRFIAGEDRQSITLLPDCLDDYTTADNPVRLVEVFADERDLGALGFAGAMPEATGRPAYHPATLLKLRCTPTETRRIKRWVLDAMQARLDPNPHGREAVALPVSQSVASKAAQQHRLADDLRGQAVDLRRAAALVARRQCQIARWR